MKIIKRRVSRRVLVAECLFRELLVEMNNESPVGGLVIKMFNESLRRPAERRLICQCCCPSACIDFNARFERGDPRESHCRPNVVKWNLAYTFVARASQAFPTAFAVKVRCDFGADLWISYPEL